MAARTPPVTKYYTELVKTFPSMAGKTVMVTGSTSGMGLVLAQTCGQLGARIVMLNRASERANKALKALTDKGFDASLVACDLSSFASVRAAGEALRARFGDSGCDVLCNNAGIMGTPDRATIDGFDEQMQANHLSHFLFTHEVWPLLEKAAELRGEARVVNHSSGARNRPSKPLMARYLQANGGNLGGDGFPGMDKWVRYQQSKLANLMFTYALDEHAKERDGNKVKVYCAHPGATDSGLQGKTKTAGGDRWLDRYVLWSTLRIAQTVEDGTCGLARCCCEPDLPSGTFLGPDAKTKLAPALLLPPERNPSAEKLLWNESMKAVGLSAFFH